MPYIEDPPGSHRRDLLKPHLSAPQQERNCTLRFFHYGTPWSCSQQIPLGICYGDTGPVSGGEVAQLNMPNAETLVDQQPPTTPLAGWMPLPIDPKQITEHLPLDFQVRVSEDARLTYEGRCPECRGWLSITVESGAVYAKCKRCGPEILTRHLVDEARWRSSQRRDHARRLALGVDPCPSVDLLRALEVPEEGAIELPKRKRRCSYKDDESGATFTYTHAVRRYNWTCHTPTCSLCNSYRIGFGPAKTLIRRGWRDEYINMGPFRGSEVIYLLPVPESAHKTVMGQIKDRRKAGMDVQFIRVKWSDQNNRSLCFYLSTHRLRPEAAPWDPWKLDPDDAQRLLLDVLLDPDRIYRKPTASDAWRLPVDKKEPTGTFLGHVVAPRDEIDKFQADIERMIDVIPYPERSKERAQGIYDFASQFVLWSKRKSSDDPHDSASPLGNA